MVAADVGHGVFDLRAPLHAGTLLNSLGYPWFGDKPVPPEVPTIIVPPYPLQVATRGNTVGPRRPPRFLADTHHRLIVDFLAGHVGTVDGRQLFVAAVGRAVVLLAGKSA